MISSKIKITILTISALLISACSKYDYSIHKPKVRYKPSLQALDKLNRSNMGKRYVWAEEGPYCFDCSGFTYFTFGSMGIDMPRVAREQFKKGIPVSKNELQKGDLVFFGNPRTGVATHVGIYIGNGKFQHASTAKKRVVISSLNKKYYRTHYLGARRYYNFNNYQPYTPGIQPEPKYNSGVRYTSSYKPIREQESKTINAQETEIDTQTQEMF